MEVLLSIVVLGIVGVAGTYLMLRLLQPRQAMLAYEQRSLVVRSVAEQVWDLFAADADAPPEACRLPPEGPPADAEFVPIDGNYSFAFRCRRYAENGQPSDKLYTVRVWLRRERDGTVEAQFEMLARVGGY